MDACWISVDDRLPEGDAFVLLFDGEEFYKGVYKPVLRYGKVSVIFEVDETEETFFYSDRVLCWLPIPDIQEKIREMRTRHGY